MKLDLKLIMNIKFNQVKNGPSISIISEICTHFQNKCFSDFGKIIFLSLKYSSKKNLCDAFNAPNKFSIQ